MYHYVADDNNSSHQQRGEDSQTHRVGKPQVQEQTAQEIGLYETSRRDAETQRGDAEKSEEVISSQ